MLTVYFSEIYCQEHADILIHTFNYITRHISRQRINLTKDANYWRTCCI